MLGEGFAALSVDLNLDLLVTWKSRLKYYSWCKTIFLGFLKASLQCYEAIQNVNTSLAAVKAAQPGWKADKDKDKVRGIHLKTLENQIIWNRLGLRLAVNIASFTII